MAAKDPNKRKIIAGIAGDTSWAFTVDRTARTQPGRDAMWRKFLDEVDPEGVLSEDEREKRAKNLQRAHYRRMSLKRWGKEAIA